MDSRLKQHELGFWEVADKPTSEELQKYYAEKYFQEGRGSYDIAYTEAELKYFVAKIEQRFHVIQQYAPAAKSMLDVGCGEGYALTFFRNKGWQAKGLDFSSAGVESKNPESLSSLVTGDLFQLLADEIASEKTYDVVWLQNVVEHVIDPLGLLRSLRKLVSPQGIAVVTFPNDFSKTQLAAQSSGHIDENFWVAPPDHLSYFDKNSFSNAAQATGWECAKVLGDFPVDWFLFHAGSNYISDRTQGKRAHLARVELENLVHTGSMDEVVEFWAALANVGMGRDLTAFLLPVDK